MANPWDRDAIVQAGVQIKPADPTIATKGPQAQADLTGTGLSNQGKAIDNQAATIGLMLKRMELDKAREEAAAAKARGDGEKDILTQARRVVQLATELRNSSANDYFATGFGSGISRLIPGTPGYDVAQNVQTIQGASALDRLAELRANSPTGGNPFGQMSNADMELLKASVAALDPGQSDARFQQNLDYIIGEYAKLLPEDERKKAMSVIAPPAASGPSGGSGGTPTLPGSGSPSSTPEDIAIQNQLDAAYRAGAPLDGIKRLSSEAGRPFSEADSKAWGEAVRSRDENGVFFGRGAPPTSGTTGFLNDAARTPAGTFAASYLNSASFGVPQAMAGDAAFDAMRDENFKSAFAGDIAGGLTGTGLATAGLVRGAGVPLGRAATAANAGYGTIFGANTNEENRLAGAGIGLASSLAGEGLGRYVAAPLATRALDTAPARAVVDRTRGMFGGRATPNPVPRAQSSLLTDIQPRMADIQANLSDAQRLGLPFSLADADAGVRQALGSASRLSPDVLTDVGRQLQDRSISQADRAIAGIGSDLTAPVSMSETAGAIRNRARAAADPLYRDAFAMPAPENQAIDDILNTPTGAKAAQDAYNIALNDGRSPAELAFAMNPDGTVRIDANPTYQTLDLVKRGLDQQLAPYRNQITGRLDLEGNPLGQSVEGMRKRFVAALDEGNPTYAQARATFADAIRPRTSLQSGYDAAAPGVTQDAFGQMTANLSPAEQATFNQGFTTSAVDRINKSRLSGNPYDLIAGTPDQQAKLSTLFPGAPDFLRRRELERSMSDTAREVLGGSPTAGRLAADARFAGPDLSDMVEIGASAAAGVPPMGVATRAVQRGARGMFGRRAQARAVQQAQEIAPILFNQDPAASSAILTELANNYARRQAYEAAIRSASGLAGGSAAAGVSTF